MVIHRKPIWAVLWPCLFRREGNQGSERGSHLPEATQLVRAQDGADLNPGPGNTKAPAYTTPSHVSSLPAPEILGVSGECFLVSSCIS